MKLHAPATERNRETITKVLAGVLPETGLVLEVASGTGEHAVHFARAFPWLDWQPSDPDPAARDSIESWRIDSTLQNLLPPLALDATGSQWPIARCNALLCINMIHISPWEAAQGLFAQAERLLLKGAPLILYGPYFEEGVIAALSNLAFNADLKSRKAEWGIRQLEDLDELGAEHSFTRVGRAEMPANNLTLIYQK